MKHPRLYRNCHASVTDNGFILICLCIIYYFVYLQAHLYSLLLYFIIIFLDRESTELIDLLHAMIALRCWLTNYHWYDLLKFIGRHYFSKLLFDLYSSHYFSSLINLVVNCFKFFVIFR